MDGIHFDDVWQSVDETTQDEVLVFWRRNSFTPPPEAAAERVRQLVFVAREVHGGIVGVCTAYRMKVDFLDNWFYGFRCMVDPDFQHRRIARTFLARTFEKLDDLSEDGILDGCIGIFVVVENPLLQARNEAIWPDVNAVFVGKNSSGTPLRVRYFSGARI